jgi:hypothetical protein
VNQEFAHEFDRQLENLLHKQYPQAAGISESDFMQLLEPLRVHAAKLEQCKPDFELGKLPFVIVVKSDLVSSEDAMAKLEFKRKPGVISMYPLEPKQFKAIASLTVPSSQAYLLVGIDRGKDSLNVAPELALETIQTLNRSPLTIDEGIAILTHFPDFLVKNNCFSMLGSRCGDRRVPALWISANAAKLGWCWDGNPQTWLGSASCAARVGCDGVRSGVAVAASGMGVDCGS